MTERAGYGVKKDYKLLQLEQNDFPILCQECMGESEFLKLLKKPLGQECKICTRPFTVFTWKIKKNTFQTLKTEICSTCAKINNCCQCCIYDLKYHLPIEIRNQLMGDKKVELLVSEGNRDIFAQLASENFNNLQLPYDQLPELDQQDLNLLRKKNLLTQEKKEQKIEKNSQKEEDLKTIEQLKLIDKIKQAKDIYDIDNLETDLCIYYVEKNKMENLLEKIYEECSDEKFETKFENNKLFILFENHKTAQKILKKYYNNLILQGTKYNIVWKNNYKEQKYDTNQPPEPEDESEEDIKESIQQEKQNNLNQINQQILIIMRANKTYDEFIQKSLEERKKISENYLAENSSKIPIIFKKSSQRLSKVKFLIPKRFTVLKLIQRIKRVCKLNHNNTFYLFADSKILQPQQQIEQVYDQHKNEDGFLYMDLQEISAFGNQIIRFI